MAGFVVIYHVNHDEGLAQPVNPKTHSAETGPLTAQRLDKWLWTSRFFRTRRLAAEAVTAGHVQVNGRRGKPGKPVKSGDCLVIRRHHEQYRILICGLARTRQSAPQVQSLYTETRESIRNRENQATLARNHRLGIQFDRRKPGKRDRRKWLQTKHPFRHAD